jgi:hypothetical protein
MMEDLVSADDTKPECLAEAAASEEVAIPRDHSWVVEPWGMGQPGSLSV